MRKLFISIVTIAIALTTAVILLKPESKASRQAKRDEKAFFQSMKDFSSWKIVASKQPATEIMGPDNQELVVVRNPGSDVLLVQTRSGVYYLRNGICEQPPSDKSVRCTWISAWDWKNLHDLALSLAAVKELKT